MAISAASLCRFCLSWRFLIGAVSLCCAIGSTHPVLAENDETREAQGLHGKTWEVRDRQVWQEMGYTPPPTAQTAAYLDPMIDAANPSVDDPLTYQSPSRPAPQGRSGFFQGANFTTTALGNHDFGMTDFNFTSVFALPAPSVNSPLLMTPGYAFHLLDGPTVTDMPSSVQDIYFDIQWIVPVLGSGNGPRNPVPGDFKVIAGITPGWFSDFNQSSSDALRIGAKLVGVYSWSYTLDIVLGGTYLDRFDVNALPVVGVVWKPNADWNLNLVFPQPKIAHRIAWYGTSERWAYVAGEFGGGSWAIRRESGADDLVAYRDWRIMLGLEQRIVGGPGALVEFGFVFNREIEYKSGTPSFKPDPTFAIRGGLNF